MADTVAPVGFTNGTTFVWNTKGQVIAAAALLPFLGIVLVALRFYSRIKYKAGLGADDWLILPALVSNGYRVRGSWSYSLRALQGNCRWPWSGSAHW